MTLYHYHHQSCYQSQADKPFVHLCKENKGNSLAKFDSSVCLKTTETLAIQILPGFIDLLACVLRGDSLCLEVVTRGGIQQPSESLVTVN